MLQHCKGVHRPCAVSGRNEECLLCPLKEYCFVNGARSGEALSNKSGQPMYGRGVHGDAGLKHLDIAFVQPAAASLSSSLSALTSLTFLALDRLLTLKQQGGCSGGALSSLLQHLRQLNLQVYLASKTAPNLIPARAWLAAGSLDSSQPHSAAALKIASESHPCIVHFLLGQLSFSSRGHSCCTGERACC